MVQSTNGVSSGVTRYNVKMAKKKGDEKVNQTPQSDNEEQNFDEEPDFDDPEGFVDDITDEGRHFSFEKLGRPYASPTHFSAFLSVCAIFVVFIGLSECLVAYIINLSGIISVVIGCNDW